MIANVDDQAGEVGILDPACGDGELIVALIDVLKSKGIKAINATVYDINESSVRIAEERISSAHPDVPLVSKVADFLNQESGRREDLFGAQEYFDFVITNPPYIRTQVLGANESKRLAAQFGLSGKVDIYHAFILALSSKLSSRGVLGAITSNKFMSNKSGKILREKILENYCLREIWDLGDTKPFEAAVLPAVIVATSGSGTSIDPDFVSVYESDKEAGVEVDSLFDGVPLRKSFHVNGGACYKVRAGKLGLEAAYLGEPWVVSDPSSIAWLERVKQKTWKRFGQVSKVRVGIKTTADNVFIKSSVDDFGQAEPELIRPLTTHGVAGRYRRTSAPLKYVLYTHRSVGGRKKPVDIDEYPVSRDYLTKHYDQLAGRSYIQKAKRNWFEIWVPQDPAKWERPKVVFRDISEKPTFWYDDEGTVVNGDCYWIDMQEDCEDLCFLMMGVANSSFIEAFYDLAFGNKLYSRRRRFLSQYVEKFPLPSPSSAIARKIAALAKSASSSSCQSTIEQAHAEIDRLVWEAFGVERL